jgi:hypothetical protein
MPMLQIDGTPIAEIDQLTAEKLLNCAKIIMGRIPRSSVQPYLDRMPSRRMIETIPITLEFEIPT